MKTQRAVAILAALLLAGCAQDAPAHEASPGEETVFTLSSPDIASDGTVPAWAIGNFAGYCDGENRSIALEWAGAPDGTESFAVSMLDGSYVHWVVTAIPATATGLAPAAGGGVTLGVVGSSIAGPGGHVGPCVGGHEYVYTVYALDTALDGSAQTSWPDAQSQMDGHILASASLTTRRPTAT